MIAKLIKIKGLVQGVGFRPFVYRKATKFEIKGTVENSSTEVKIIAQGNKILDFVEAIKNDSPPAASIFSIEIIDFDDDEYHNFSIVKSSENNNSEDITQVSPDIAVCDDCLEDMISQTRRIAYPFTNCTNCGPRFTIIRDLPYDRHQTTMLPFAMCPDCHSEYTDILDRRFHAQPISCDNCGPSYELIQGDSRITEFSEIISKVANVIDSGGTLAFKGMGGFNLVCDAGNERAVRRLREIKNREGKPFAVMFKDVNAINKYCEVNEEEIELINGWRKPILLLTANQQNKLADSVCNGFSKIGAFLPYMPIHYLMFERIKSDVIVMTSGNISDEPIIIDNQKAEATFLNLCDAVLTYDREIHNRADDSVTFVANGEQRLIRRSRGFAPQPIISNLNVNGIFAAGAELNNTFAIGKGNQTILSQHIGDLKNYETYEFYRESALRFFKLFKFTPELSVCDNHPDYLSTKFAEELSIPIVRVQHHHSHIASAMLENNLDEEVIGICFDGTGLGDDGNIWGSEFMICSLRNYERIFHYDYFEMPGGDIAAKETRRLALSLTTKYGLPFEKAESDEMIIKAIERGINSPKTCGAGRYFDVAAYLIGVCKRNSFHAESPMRLEDIVDANCEEAYHFDFADDSIILAETFRELLDDLERGKSKSIISTKFHNTIVKTIAIGAERIRRNSGISKVALSGGVFQNRFLLEQSEITLSKMGFTIIMQTQLPTNDGGIAAGQIAIASANR